MQKRDQIFSKIDVDLSFFFWIPDKNFLKLSDGITFNKRIWWKFILKFVLRSKIEDDLGFGFFYICFIFNFIDQANKYPRVTHPNLY